jgi:type IV fimbrial biogenesis protein FimT
MSTTANIRQRGFTLGETLASLAVVGLGLALATPGLKALSGSNRQAASVNQLVATMHLARSEAITRNARVTVCASSDGEVCDSTSWDKGWIAFLDANADQDRDATEQILEQVPALAGLQVRSAEFERAFSYRPNGRAVGNGPDDMTGSFSFCEPGADQATRVVIVRANGLPALVEAGAAGSAARCREA